MALTGITTETLTAFAEGEETLTESELSDWLWQQQIAHQHGDLSQEQIAMLEALPEWRWVPWEETLAELEAFVKENVVLYYGLVLGGVKCRLCPKTVDDLYEAVRKEWIPSYYNGNDQERGPVCAACTDSHLKYDESTGTYELIATSN